MHVDKPLLEKYFKGHCTAEEAAAVEAYLLQEATPEMDAYLLETWEQSVPAPVIPIPPAAPARVKPLYSRWYSVAAAMLLLIAAAGIWRWQLQQPATPQVLALQTDTIYNNSRNIRLVSMPDGSRVWLNAYASIVYAGNYNDTSRELWLNGEAYFEVAKAAGKPFRVHVEELVTTALGTSFNIATANHADSSIAVSLLSGKVSVSTTAFSYVLQPGQVLFYKKGMPPAPATRFNLAETMDWKNGKLIFDNTTLENAFAKLQSRYGLRIILKDTRLGSRKVSGSFTAGETFEQVLTTLQFVYGFTYEQSGDSSTYYIVSSK
jgi:ferric-dicitrate binding protein FerR (iron transport regulator)